VTTSADIFYRIAGFLMQVASSNDAIKYVGCFFAASGSFPMTPQLMAWISNNVGGSMKRSTSIAFIVMCCNLASISSAFMYLPRMAPKYRPGHSTLLILLCIEGLLAAFMRSYFVRQNAKRERIKPAATYTKLEKMQQSDMGEYAGFFRFII